MRFSIRAGSALAFTLLFSSACGSSDDAAPAGTAGLSGDLSDFSGACTGSLKRESDLLVENLSGAWASQSGLTAPAGAKVLWAKDVFGKLGYARLADGRVAQVKPLGGGELTAEADLTTTCAGKGPVFTLLKAAVVHAKQDLSDTGCQIPAGTQLAGAQATFKGADAPWELSGAALAARCGVDAGWVSDLRAADLFTM